MSSKEDLMTKTLSPSQSPESSPIHQLLAMMFGTVQAQLVRVAAQLRIADLLKDGPQSIATLAETTKIPSSSLARMLKALAALGLVQETATDFLTPTVTPWEKGIPVCSVSVSASICSVHYKHEAQIFFRRFSSCSRDET